MKGRLVVAERRRAADESRGRGWEAGGYTVKLNINILYFYMCFESSKNTNITYQKYKIHYGYKN